MTSCAILIPARYESKRFPGKPLCKLHGKEMIRKVFIAASQSDHDVFVLTDDKRIADLFDPSVVFMETADYENGTERCAGAIKDKRFDKYDNFINVQGDMPDVRVDMIEDCLDWIGIDPVHTLFTDMPEELCDDPNTVKLVISNLDSALWFGRGITGYGERHLGVYGYTREALEKYPTLKVTKEEQIEQLEQLRWLKSDWTVGCSYVEYDGIEINEPLDAIKYNLRPK